MSCLEELTNEEKAKIEQNKNVDNKSEDNSLIAAFAVFSSRLIDLFEVLTILYLIFSKMK